MIAKPKTAVVFAKGGPANLMFEEQAAGPAKAGRTGKNPTAAPGAKSAARGPKTRGASVVVPAAPGRTAPKKGR